MSKRDKVELDSNAGLETSVDAFDDWGYEVFLDETGPESAGESGDGAGLAALDVEAAATTAAATSPKRSRSRDGSGPHPVVLGLLVWTAVVAAGVGLVAAALRAVGAPAARLLSFDGLTSGFDAILAFGQHPANLFWIVAAGVFLLALLAAAACGRAVTRHRCAAGTLAATLERLRSLRLEDENGWKDDAFQADPGLAAFLGEILSNHRLMQAKLTRYVSQDGELRRLEKALVDGSRQDMCEGYDNPTVASLADEVVRVFDARIAAERARDDLNEQVRSGNTDLTAVLQEACHWNCATLDQINLQGAAMERVAVKVKQIAEIARELSENAATDGREDLLGEVHQFVEAQAGESDGDPGEALSHLSDLVDRGSKLAFQIAMEVARLGPRGERLLPMTQELEEVTTAFRRLSSDLQTGLERHHNLGLALGELARRLDNLAEPAAAETNSDADASNAADGLASRVMEVVPLTRQASEKLLDIARGFNRQTDRLVAVGERCAGLAGLPFSFEKPVAGTPAVDAEPPSFAVDRFDPFHTEPRREPTQAPDPFATAPDSLFGETDESEDASVASPFTAADLEIFRSDPEATASSASAAARSEAADPTATVDFAREPAASEPVASEPVASEPVTSEPVALEPAALEPAALEPASTETGTLMTGAHQTGAPETHAPTTGAQQTGVPGIAASPGPKSGGTARELESATPAAAEPVAASSSHIDDRIYDLSEFDAAAIDEATSRSDGPAAAEHRIYDLSEFGAVQVG